MQDDGTRAAISEQLHRKALLTRKMNTMRDDSDSDDSSDSDTDDDISGGSDQEGKLKMLERAKKKTLEVLQDDEIPNSGLLSLPFMVIFMGYLPYSAYLLELVFNYSYYVTIFDRPVD